MRQWMRSWQNWVMLVLSLIVVMFMTKGWLWSRNSASTTPSVAVATGADAPKQSVAEKVTEKAKGVAEKVAEVVASPVSSKTGLQAPSSAPPGLASANRQDQNLRDELNALLHDREASREERISAAKELAKFPSAGISHDLEVVMLTDSDPAIRHAAALSLGLTGFRGNVAGLQRSIQQDPDPKVREAAGKALALINDRKGMPPTSAMSPQRSAQPKVAPVLQDQDVEDRNRVADLPLPMPIPQ